MRPLHRSDGSKRHGLTLEGSQIALGPARALSSHARRIYAAKYLGRYKLAPWVFALDAFLVGAALALCVTTVVFLFAVPSRLDGGLAVAMTSVPLRGSEASPITVTVRASDGKAHHGVSLRVELPEWAEIIRSEPERRADGSMHIGTVSPRNPGKAIVVIRPRAADTDMRVVFRAHQDDWIGFVRDIDGSDMRHVGPSALAAETDADATSTTRGGVIPFTVRNTASITVPSVIFRITGVEGGAATVGGSDSFAIGTLGAGESRRVFVDVGETASSSLAVFWQLQDGAQAVASGISNMPVSSRPADQTDIRFPDGTFPLLAEARYYSGSGDQIGIGPLPPQVGMTTTYWAAFTVGPTDGGMKDMRLRAALPPGVSATGKYAAPIEASFGSEIDVIEFRIPAVPAIGAARLSFAFEIRFTPSAAQAGMSVPLVSSVAGRASSEDGLPLIAASASATTDLATDAKAAGKGIIRP